MTGHISPQRNDTTLSAKHSPEHENENSKVKLKNKVKSKSSVLFEHSILKKEP